MQKTFFVVTPYGDAHSEDKQEQTIHALISGLRANILDVAVKKCRSQGFDVKIEFGSDTARGDTIWEKIGTQMSHSHGVIGILATDKPNTGIEIGLAFGLWYTPILLRFKDYPVPSDLAGHEIPTFTRAQALGEADATEVVDWLVGRLMTTPVRQDKKTPPYLPPTTSSDGRVRTYDRFSKAIDVDEWSDMLWSADSEIIIASPKMAAINKVPFNDRKNKHADPAQDTTTLKTLLTTKVINDFVNVSIILPDPDSVHYRDLKRPLDDKEEALEEYKESLELSKKRWFTVLQTIEIERQMRAQKNEPDIGRFEIILTSELYFPHRLTMTEKRMLLTLRFYKEQFNSRFCVDAGPQSEFDAFETPIYELIRQDIAAIREGDGPRSRAAFENWRDRKAS